MARIATTSPSGETIMDRLRRAYTVNLENSERLMLTQGRREILNC